MQSPEKADAVGDADVVDALGRVLQSAQFTRSPRARGFLAYVVTETLSGRGERLSERTVARRALDRGPHFDGRDDASVRVQAGRVRKYLEDYYADEGADDPVRISLPRGSYVPSFERWDEERASGQRVPGVVVVMLTSAGETPAELFARSMSELLVQSLVAHTHIRVVGPIDSVRDAATSATNGGVSGVLTGHVSVRDGRLSLAVRVVDASTSTVVWSREASVDLDELSGFDVEEQWSREIAATVGDPAGPVIRQEVARRSASTRPELAARLAFYAYLDSGSESSVHEAVAALDEALDAGHRTPTLLAMRAAMANTCSVYEFADRDVELDRAESLAREALAQDGGHVHAHLVLSWPALQRGQVGLAVDLAETAARLAPYQPFALSTAGMALITCGEWQRGSALIRESLRLNPSQSAQTHSWLAMAHLAEGDYERALAEAALLPSEGEYFWGPLFRAMALAGVGYTEQAQVECARAWQIRPDVMPDVGAHLGGVFRLTPEQLDRLVALVPAPATEIPEQRGVRSLPTPLRS